MGTTVTSRRDAYLDEKSREFRRLTKAEQLTALHDGLTIIRWTKAELEALYRTLITEHYRHHGRYFGYELVKDC